MNPPRRPAPWPVQFYRSAVGKKWVMAITGIMLMGFVFGHMVGNLKMYQGAHALNVYGESLRELLYPLLPRTLTLWIIRIGLILAFVFHIHAAASLTLMNRRANAGGYESKRSWQAANTASRSMRFTGIVILAYLIWHLADFTWGWVNPDFVRGDVYRNVQASLTNAIPAAIYVLATLALGVHLFHGAWSLFQSLGLNNPKYNSWRRGFAMGFAGLITIGNLSFPLAVVSGAASDDVCYEEGDRIVTCETVFAEAIEDGRLSIEQYDELSDGERLRIIKAYEANEELRFEEGTS
ncbi:succinate dehydrogenase cytochrome b subunit [Acidimicrobiia bacterium EGI L10123]|uniref:succinate dehydrogenase cytochrome b subunit n=1 Tax=Salinilacustrithrix flava TaxID=2957203 RepID=UPI003D7C31C3|nr:succinate dehydrogenase cytochrome b subunit [Acidimicrobiia bacterium EGI L10123]